MDVNGLLNMQRFIRLKDRLTPTAYSSTINEDGGAGSGNFGHAGRPGEVGGSAGTAYHNIANQLEEGHGRKGKIVSRKEETENASALSRVNNTTSQSEKSTPVSSAPDKVSRMYHINLMHTENITDDREATKLFSQAKEGDTVKFHVKDKNGKDRVINFRKVGTKEFSEKLQEAHDTNPDKDKWRVTVHTQEELENDESLMGAQLYVTEHGSTVAVTKSGDIISVCAYRHTDKSLNDHGRDLIMAAFAMGGDRLDSYAGNHGFYEKCGLTAMSGCDFDTQYANDDWKAAHAAGLADAEEIIFYGRLSKEPVSSSADEAVSRMNAEGHWYSLSNSCYSDAQNDRNSQMEKQ